MFGWGFFSQRPVGQGAAREIQGELLLEIQAPYSKQSFIFGILCDELFSQTHGTIQVGKDLKRSSGPTFRGKGNLDVII